VKTKDAVALGLLLWWLWPRLHGESTTSCTWINPDTGETAPCPEDISYNGPPSQPIPDPIAPYGPMWSAAYSDLNWFNVGGWSGENDPSTNYFLEN
jgi:hypothetical protein